jgi:hypothetical protein
VPLRAVCLVPSCTPCFTHDWMAEHDSNAIVKFADNTTVIGLITDNETIGMRSETWQCGAMSTTSHSMSA